MSKIEKQKINILYLEDDIIVRDSVQRMLELLVSNVFVATNGLEALEVMHDNSKKIDIIVSDIKMPKMDGLEFLEQLKSEHTIIPVILVTAFNDFKYLIKAIELKVDKFIQKPVNMKRLREDISVLIQTIMRKKELDKKRVQLEQYKKAISLSNFIIEIDTKGEINTISTHPSNYFEEKINMMLTLTNIKEIFSQQFFEEIFESINNFEVFNSNAVINMLGEKFIVNVTAFPSEIEEHNIYSISLILKDLTHILKEKDKTIKKLYTDSNTGLPNKQALFKEMNEKKGQITLLLVQIDDFEKYKHVYGHKISDIILKESAKELLLYCPDKKERIIYKLDSEIFAISILKNEISDIEKVTSLANNIIEHMDKYVVSFDNISIDITVSIGASGKGKNDLLIEALIALDYANTNKKKFQCFKLLIGIEEKYNENIMMQQKIKKAFVNDCVIPYYQPIVDKNKKIVKYEALARIKDPDCMEKIITPFFFLDIIKSSKHNEKFTKTMIKTALNDMKKLNCGVSINLSFEDIINPAISTYLEEVLNSNQEFPITIELLENESIKDIKQTIDFCNQMKNHGAQIAIDDFGSGYSNYEYFFDIPIDIIKIDGSITKRIDDYKGYALLESIVTFAKKLNLKIVVEFVEDEHVFEKLKTLDIEMFQGYFISAPQSLENIIAGN